MTLISVIMPVNKANPYLEKAIQSVLAQTFEDFEFIVVLNGGDLDFKREFIEKYSCFDKVRVLDTEFNFLPFSLNYAIQQSIGDIIVRMDSDDVCEPFRLEKIAHCFSTSECDVVYSNYSFIDEHDNVIGFSSINSININKWLPFRCVIPHPTSAYKRDVVMRAGGYMYGIYSEDYDLWLRLRRQGLVMFKCIPDSLLKYRVHAGQATNRLNLFTIGVYDFCLKLRELFISKDYIYLLALAVLPLDVLYQFFLGYKRKRKRSSK